MEVARDWGDKEMGWCLMGAEFQGEMIRQLWGC
jgi:hypothetical protein